MWDILHSNVLKDSDNDIYIVDAEIKKNIRHKDQNKTIYQ